MQFVLQDFLLAVDIGKGVCGNIYKAKHISSSHLVAIKILPKKKYDNQFNYRQLRRQIIIHSKLKHQNICQLYAYFTSQNCIYLVLQYYSSDNLCSVIKNQRTKFSNSQVAFIFYQLVKAVAYLHQRHITHRDIKLENIIINQKKIIKLIDFGLAVHSQSLRTTFCGTLQYLSLELLDNEPYGREVDIYCLGIVLYELYYKKSPFSDVSQHLIIRKIRQGNIKFGKEVNLPPIVKQLIISLLNKDRKKRPKASDLLNHKFFQQFLIEKNELSHTNQNTIN